MKNYWTARTEPVLVEWEATFPPVSGDYCHLLQLAQGILKAGERESVYRILETRSPDPFYLKPFFSYIDYLQKMVAQTGYLPLFGHGTGVATTAAGTLRTPSQISFFDVNGQLVEKEVENVGLLLKSLRPDDVADGGEAYMSQVAPVTIESWPPIPVREELRVRRKARPIRLTISLYTDIWFPCVMGWLEEPCHKRFVVQEASVDNRRIAACHTPRLNRFLYAVHQLVLALGGSWQLREPEGTAKLYAPMVDQHGIKLPAMTEKRTHHRSMTVTSGTSRQTARSESAWLTESILHPAISEQLAAEVQTMLFSERQKIKAIRRVREETHLGLLEAKAYVDAVLDLKPSVSPQLEAKVRQILGQGKRQDAITWLRTKSGLGIKESKAYVDGLLMTSGG